MTTLYTIGHGRHAFGYFLELLQQFEIGFLCDVRTAARSRWPQFNSAVLRELLAEHGLGYEHLPECGGRRRPVAEELEWGLGRIIDIAAEVPTVLMCSESRPLTQHKVPRANCHRVGMLSPLLKARGVARIIHILPDGRSLEFDESTTPWLW